MKRLPGSKSEQKRSLALLWCLRCISCHVNKVPSHSDGSRCHLKRGWFNYTMLPWGGPEGKCRCLHLCAGYRGEAVHEGPCWRPPPIFQLDGVPVHNSNKMQIWPEENLKKFWSKKILPPSSPAEILMITSCGAFVWEKSTNTFTTPKHLWRSWLLR